jgi:hypothetical protein
MQSEVLDSRLRGNDGECDNEIKIYREFWIALLLTLFATTKFAVQIKDF